MTNLMQITGLDLQSLSEITGFLLSLISFSVFIGIIMYDVFDGFCAFSNRLIRSACAFILKKIKKG